MVPHRFGGDWTEQKLNLLRKYLPAYNKVFEGNPKGQYFTRWYIDAFAGTGDRIASESEAEREKIRDGSARIALSTNPPFQKFLFIEKSPKYAEALKALSREYYGIRDDVSIKCGDANTELVRWCQSIDAKTNRAVVFIDPKGMQLEWKTLVVLAQTHAVDVWILIPFGVGISRLLPKSNLPSNAWANRLTTFLGTDEWREFYREDPQKNLFELLDIDPNDILNHERQLIRDISIEGIGNFVLKRLSTVFESVSDTPYVLRNSRGNPLYLFCFAASNKKGAQVGMKIANDILEKAHYGR